MLSKKVGWVNSSGIGWYWCDTKLEAALNESKGVMAMPRMRSWDVSEANERNIKKRHHIFTVDDVPSYLIILRSALQFPHAVWLISIFGQIKVFLRHSKCKFLTDTTDTCFRGTKRRVLHGRILSNEFMLAISTIVWSGVILLVWNTHVHYFMIYTERERERDDINTNIPVTVPEVPDIASSGPFLPSQGGATTHVHGRNPISGTLSLENCVQDSICLICQCMQLLKYLHRPLSMPCYTILAIHGYTV